MEVLWIVGIAAAVLLTVATVSGGLVWFAVKCLPAPDHPYNFLARFFRAHQRAHDRYWETLLEEDKPRKNSR